MNRSGAAADSFHYYPGPKRKDKRHSMKFVFDYGPSDSPFVEMIWRTRSAGAGSFMSQAASQWEMVITKHQGRTTLTARGPETKASLADVTTAEVEYFGIIFRHGAFMPHLPPGRLIDRRDASLPAAADHSFWLHGSAWQYPSFDNADLFVSRLFRQRLLVYDPVVEAALQGQVQNLSARSLQRHFLRATGLTHGAIRQIQRARCALSLLEQGTSIGDTVEQAGYADQPHLTRALRRYIGQTPAQLLTASRSR